MSNFQILHIEAEDLVDAQQQLKQQLSLLMSVSRSTQTTERLFESIRSVGKDPRIKRSWWSYEPNGQSIERARLEETVYFNIETIGFPHETTIDLSLRDYDSLLFGIDLTDIDDKLFNGEELHKKISITYGNAGIVNPAFPRVDSIALYLDPAWEPMLADDKAAFQDKAIDLYWKASYRCFKNQKVYKETLNIPASKNDYLKVFFPERTLYIKSPAAGYDLPEFLSADGHPMVPVAIDFFVGKLKDQVQDVAEDHVKESLTLAAKNIEKEKTKIALAKLAKGELVTNLGNVYENQYIYNFNEQFDGDGNRYTGVKRGNHFKKYKKGVVETTIGVNQIDYFKNNGEEVRKFVIKGRMTKMSHEFIDGLDGKFFDIIDLTKFAMNEDAMDEPLPLSIIHPIGIVSEITMGHMKAEDDALLEEHFLLELEQAKQKGLDAVREFVESPVGESLRLYLIDIQNQETLSKIISGEFISVAALEDFDLELTDRKFNQGDDDAYDRIVAHVLYRSVKNDYRDEYVDVIETILFP